MKRNLPETEKISVPAVPLQACLTVLLQRIPLPSSGEEHRQMKFKGSRSSE